MFELVPSQFMRDYFKEINFEFTDFQKATLIWNAPKKRREILDALKELSEITSDKNVKKQILERIDYENKLFKLFVSNKDFECVYVVEDEDEFFGSIFYFYDAAVRYAIMCAEGLETKVYIRKCIVKTQGEYKEFSGVTVATVSLDMNGEIERMWLSETIREDDDVVDQYDRFECSFIAIPFDMPMGVSVKNVVDGTYGILATGKEEWYKYLEMIKDNFLFFSDIQVMVYELTEKGYWSCKYVNPMHLDIEFPPYIQDSGKRNAFRRAMKALGDYLSHKSKGQVFCPDLVIKYAREYATYCQEKSIWERILEEAKEPEDIMNLF